MFGLINTALFFGKYIKEAMEPELPAEYHNNWKLEMEDADKVRFGEMTQAQFNRNIKNGKYYAAPQIDLKADKTKYETYLYLRMLGTLNMECDFGKYNYIKKMSKEEAKEKYYESYFSDIKKSKEQN